MFERNDGSLHISRVLTWDLFEWIMSSQLYLCFDLGLLQFELLLLVLLSVDDLLGIGDSLLREVLDSLIPLITNLH